MGTDVQPTVYTCTGICKLGVSCEYQFTCIIIHFPISSKIVLIT